jgi:transposase
VETPFVSDVLWQRIQPLLPPARPRRTRCPGRKPLDNRKVLVGILHVLRTGISWGRLPADLGCGCGISCWKYLRAWQQCGAWPRIRAVLQDELAEADFIDWGRADFEVEAMPTPGDRESWPQESAGLSPSLAS